MHVVAIVGMTGAGKSELARLFSEKGYQLIRFGDITEEHIKKRGLPLNEESEKAVREALRKEHGMDAYAKLNYPRIKEALARGHVVIDGLYSWEEHLLLRGQLGPQLLTVAVYAPPETRYDRLAEREVRGLTREQARARDHHELEKLNKAAPIAMADYTILNVGTLFDLAAKRDSFFEWLQERDEEGR